MPAIINVQDVTIYHPNTSYPSVDNVTFSIQQGSIAALVGPNGSGKTTLIRALLGLIPFSGSIEIMGSSVEQVTKNIGYVPQRFQFDYTFPITVREFLELSQLTCTDSRHIKQANLKSVAKRVNISHKLDQLLVTLSGGELQRLLLARALIHQPKLLILDEPEAGVDIGGEQSFYEILEDLSKTDNITALIASHELDIVYAYADTVICINKQLICQGPPKQVLDQSTFQKLYGRGLKFYAHSH